jgi:hypothetical protein
MAQLRHSGGSRIQAREALPKKLDTGFRWDDTLKRRGDTTQHYGRKLDQRERGPALEPSDGAWLAILRNSSSSVILSIALSVD